MTIGDTIFGGFAPTNAVEAILLPSVSTNRVSLGSAASESGIESIFGGAQSDYISAESFGTSGIVIYDLAGSNTLIGSAGDDLISGSTSNSNLLRGLAGNDTIIGGSGNDTLDGGEGNDSLQGKSGNDFYKIDSASDIVVELADSGTDSVLAQVSGLSLAANTEWLILDSNIQSGTGNSLANTLVGNSSANTLNGGTGNDSLAGLGGNDYYIIDSLTDSVLEAASSGTDSIEARVSNYTLAGNAEALILGDGIATGHGNSLANSLFGNSLANTLSGNGGADTMAGGSGNDYYVVDSLSNIVIEDADEGRDSVLAQVSGYTLAGDTEYLILGNGVGAGFGNSLNNTLLGNSIANTLNGGDGNDTIDGGTGNDTLIGGEGADSLIGGAGADFYFIDNVGDKVFESLAGDIDTVVSSVDFTLGGNVERLTLTGGALSGTGNSLNNTIVGNSLSNTLDGGIGADSLVGSTSDDYFIIDNLGDTVVETASAGIDSVFSSVSNYILAANVEVLILGASISAGTGNSLNNTVIGNAASNTLLGDAGNDWIQASAGNDWLNGGTGNDTMDGGIGNDYYIIDNLADEIIESSLNGGTDSVFVAVSGYTLAGNTEWLILDAAVSAGTGNSTNNTLIGNLLNNTLNGGEGADSLIGGLGNDYYVIDSLSDKVIESLGGGTDSVLTEISGYTLTANTEWLILGDGVLAGYGNSLGNTLIGNSLGNTLDAGGGADSMAGGQGNDTYIVSDAENAIFESTDGGIDTVISTANLSLGANLEKLILTGAASYGFGNSLANTITGNSLANTLDGGTGNDSLIGGVGNDYYIIDSLSDEISEASLNGGTDSVLSKIGGYTLEDNLEFLILGNSVTAGTGNSAANTLVGNSTANTLDGGLGNDSLAGLAGNDYYIIDSTSDKVFEEINAGTDSVLTQVSGYTLSGNTEWLILASTIESGTGNSLANTLVGNSADNTLNGGLGNDSLFGGAGDDYYIVDSLADMVAETLGLNSITASLNGGIDSVLASVSGYTLSGYVEWLTLESTIGAGSGNALANTIVGNSASNTLDGGAGNDSIDAGAGNDWLNGGTGNDTLLGGLGNDYYFIDSQDDALTESSPLGGLDSVFSTISHTLGDNFEVLILGGAAASGTGNSLANTLIGNSLANTLDGGSGNDSLAGGVGNDFYITDSLTDAIFEAVGAGTDSVLAKISNYTLAGNTEWLKLDDNIGAGIGNSLANTLLGNSLANTLNGGAGNDSLAGGDGDDFYFVDSLSDIVFESLNGGLDSVIANVSGYTLSGNVEWLRLDSTVAAGTGNSLANTLIGNASANTLDGGTGNDSLVGLAGNDYYIIDSLSDEILESSLSGGVDSVLSKISGYTLDDNVEVLILSGTTGVGTGNSLANTLIGNSLANTLDGGLGNDSLVGLAGNDYYKINSLSDAVVEAAGDGIDSVLANVNNYTLAGNADWLILDANIASGTGNSLANTLLGNAEDNTLDGGLGADSLIGGAGDDYYIIENTKDIVIESTGNGVDSVVANLGVYTLVGNAEVLIFGTGTTGIGNNLDNTLIGNSMSNLITGSTGNDSLFGGGGSDDLTGCTNLATGGKGEKDTLTGGIGNDNFNLGSALGVFYNDGVAGNAGIGDYAFITDFTIGRDILTLKGTATQYTLGDHAVSELPSYKGLYYKSAGATDELIAIIQTLGSETLTTESLLSNAQYV